MLNALYSNILSVFLPRRTFLPFFLLYSSASQDPTSTHGEKNEMSLMKNENHVTDDDSSNNPVKFPGDHSID